MKRLMKNLYNRNKELIADDLGSCFVYKKLLV